MSTTAVRTYKENIVHYWKVLFNNMRLEFCLIILIIAIITTVHGDCEMDCTNFEVQKSYNAAGDGNSRLRHG